MGVHDSNAIDAFSNEIDTFPRSQAVTGTVQSFNDNRDIVGTGTSFFDVFQVGEYLFSADKSEVRRIAYIQSDTKITLDEPFSGAALPALTVIRRVPRPNRRSISFQIDAAGTAAIDGQTLPANTSNTFHASGNNSVGRQYQTPIVIDSTSNSNVVYVSATK